MRGQSTGRPSHSYTEKECSVYICSVGGCENQSRRPWCFKTRNPVSKLTFVNWTCSKDHMMQHMSYMANEWGHEYTEMV